MPLTLSGSIIDFYYVLPASKGFFSLHLYPQRPVESRQTVASDGVDSFWYSSSDNRDSQSSIPFDNGIILEFSANLKLWGVWCGLIAHSAV